MQELIELIHSINIGRMKSSGLWALVFEAGSPLEKLCEAISQGQVACDEEAVALLHPGEAEGAGLSKLKEQLKAKLLEVVFLLEFRTEIHSDRQKAYLECSKKWAAVSVLMAKSSRQTAVGLLEELLKQTIHYEFTDLTVSVLAALRLHHGTISGDTAKYTLYRKMHRSYQAVALAEDDAEDSYTYLANQYVKSKSNQHSMSEEAQACLDRLAPVMGQSGAFKLHLCGRLIEVMLHMSKNDYAATARVCEEAVAFFGKQPFKSKIPLQTFYYQWVVCCVQLQQFEKGEEIIKRSKSAFGEGTVSWFKLQELYFMLAMYTGRYQRAFDLSESIQRKLRSGSQPAFLTETWMVYDAYAQFLRHIGKVKSTAASASRFKQLRFFGDIPLYSRDNQGINLSILILQTLFNLAGKQYERATASLESLEKYSNRYLKQNQAYRSYCFIKALLQFPAASFQPELAARKGLKYIDMMRTRPIEVAYRSYDMEIIPYEHLWEIALQLLKQPETQPAPSKAVPVGDRF